MQLFVSLDDQLAAAIVRQTHADARVFHRAGQSDRLTRLDGGVIVGPDRLERLHKAGLRPDDLPVRQDAAGADGVAQTDLQWRNADLVGHFVQQRLDREAGLRDAKAAERARGRIVGVVGGAFDLKILVGVGAGGVRTRALEHRAAERGERAGVGHDLRLDALDDAVFVAAHREIHPERVPLRVDEQRFGAAELHLDRQARHVGDERGVVLHGHVLLAAEAAADELVLHLDLL